MKNNFFDVDLKGLSDLIEDAGPGRLVMELVRNSLDEDGVTEVKVALEMQPNRPLCMVRVEDDAPGGFIELSHSYTLFASSYKKAHVEKAGRFNMGDKLFLAAAILTGEAATIFSTTGGVEFTLTHGRTAKRTKTDRGSQVSGFLKMTREQYQKDVIDFIQQLLVPSNVRVTVNGQVLHSREPLHTFTAKLATVEDDGTGVLRAVKGGKECKVEVYEPQPGEAPMLYELGMPVVETNDKWHLNIGQKVPLNMNRDNVPPQYLRHVRTLVVNELFDRLTPEDANTALAREATSDPRISSEAMNKALDLRFTEKRVAYDPNDQEANNKAVLEGFTVVSGRMMNADEWDNARKTGSVPAAGKLFPTPKPFSDDPNAPTAEFISPDEWTPGMKRVAAFCRYFHMQIIGEGVQVRILKGNQGLGDGCSACYSKNQVTFSLKRLGHRWFDDFSTENCTAVFDIVLDEFGHFYASNHLSPEYYRALRKLGAGLADLCLNRAADMKRVMG